MESRWTGRIHREGSVRNGSVPFLKGLYKDGKVVVPARDSNKIDVRIRSENTIVSNNLSEKLMEFGVNIECFKWCVLFLLTNDQGLQIIHFNKLLENTKRFYPFKFSNEDIVCVRDFLIQNGFIKFYQNEDLCLLIPQSKIKNLFSEVKVFEG